MTICLNMIVKDEAHVIRRCLASVKDIISYWVIVDTGSTDGTQEIIKEFLKDVQGELHERPWVNFSHNRNEALAFAKSKADYLLIIDADDLLVYEKDFKMPPLTKDFYIVLQQDEKKEIDTQWILLIKNSLNWRWNGVTHEVLYSPEMRCSELLSGVVNLYLQDGNRSRSGKKFENDIVLLEEDLLRNPTNTRTAFYLAESYRGAQNYPMAIKSYERRVGMNGSEEEVFWSLYCIAMLEESLGYSGDVVMDHYARAYRYRPSRIEPLYHIISRNMNSQGIITAYRIAKSASSVPLSQDAVFVCRWIYEWGILFEYALCSKALGFNDEYQNLVQKLLSVPTLPDSIRSQLQK